MSKEQREEMLLTRDEAVKLVKKVTQHSCGTFCLHVRLDAPVIGETGVYFPDGCATYLRLSRAQALSVVKDMLSPTLEGRGARIKVTKSTYPGSDKPTYWIG